jgi:DNA-binding NtrC family response regulator
MKRILVVDDEQDLLDVVSDYLGDRYEVTTVTSAAAAVDAFRCRRPDIVFLGVNMSGGSAVDTLAALRELDASVPVVMVTVNMEVGVAKSCLERGAFAYVPKPVDLDYMEHMADLASGMTGRPPGLTHS